MLICLGAAALIASVQWRSISSDWVVNARKSPAHSPAVTLPALSRASTVRLVVDLSDRRVYLYKGKKLRTSYPLAVGQPGWETPTGTFRVIQMDKQPAWQHPITGTIVSPGPDSPLGKRWIGFLLNDKSLIGFHGTNQEDLIGKAVSHGCLRMRNKDVIALYTQISLGTPVKVQP